MNPLFKTDGYKLGHHQQYPEKTTRVNSNFTPRRNSYGVPNAEGVLFVGLQYIIKKLHSDFRNNFFRLSKASVCADLRTEFSMYTGADYDVSHFEKLHDLGYLPIRVKALPEGSIVPFGVPMLTVENTHDDFYWITNYLETYLSNMLWLPTTSATTALAYRQILEKFAKETDKANLGFVKFQTHDFSMRGMGGLDATILSGIGHDFVFDGSDNIPTISVLRQYYGAEGFIIGGVPATEHSVMSAGGKETEKETFSRLLSLYPKGIVSIVSDTWDLWNVLTEILPSLKEQIMNRDGKIVVRPDSGDPVDIICGRDLSKFERVEYGGKGLQPEHKGVVELLWDTFGGTINEQGYKVLDSHVGCIYGDAITLERCQEICERLKAKGFASTNVVFGVGSYTYQMKTRDTYGMAMKATYAEINGEGVNLFKDPITDSGLKKSATGLLRVDLEDGKYVLRQQQTREQEQGGCLETIYENGKQTKIVYFNEIKSRINSLFQK